MSSSPDYPDPPLEHPLFNLNALPDPPARQHIFGQTPEEASRNCHFKRNELEQMVKFHFWGINPNIHGRPTNVRMFRALMKLMYFLDERHRPQSWEQVRDTTRDAGPRLLSCSIDGVLFLPISRHYPHPPGFDGQTQPGYIRPFWAADRYPDSYLEQMLKVVPEPVTNTASTTQDDSAISLGDSISDGDLMNQPDPFGDTIMGSPRFATSAAQIDPLVYFENTQSQAVVEAIERAVSQFAYSDLERHPSAAPRAPRPHLTATSEEDLFKSIASSAPAALKVSLLGAGDSNTASLDRNGTPFIYRGRGPVWRANSCAVDCAIVVGRLLDAGSTVFDRKEVGWESRLPRAERAFIDATDANWDVLSRDDSANLRDSLWQVLAESSSAVRVGMLNPLSSVWATATANIPQFRCFYFEALRHCACRELPANVVQYQSYFLTPSVYPEDWYGVTMQEVVSRLFQPIHVSNCRECQLTGTVTRERRINNLPPRMVITLDERAVVKDHTRDITFDYHDTNGRLQKATYRWLGGVYAEDNHFRVFWTDAKRGEANSGEIQTYDGMQNAGLITGGISPYHADERVPPQFWRGKSIPLLFYERVMNPDPLVLSCALDSVFDMMNAQAVNQPILQTHTPWTRTGVPADVPARQWDPILPAYGDRFHDVPAAYIPQQQQQQPPTNPMPTPNSSIPITQHLNQSNSGFRPGAGNTDAMDISSTPALKPDSLPQESFFLVPSPTPSRPAPPPLKQWISSPPMPSVSREPRPTSRPASPPWDQWIRFSPMRSDLRRQGLLIFRSCRGRG